MGVFRGISRNFLCEFGFFRRFSIFGSDFKVVKRKLQQFLRESLRKTMPYLFPTTENCRFTFITRIDCPKNVGHLFLINQNHFLWLILLSVSFFSVSFSIFHFSKKKQKSCSYFGNVNFLLRKFFWTFLLLLF